MFVNICAFISILFKLIHFNGILQVHVLYLYFDQVDLKLLNCYKGSCICYCERPKLEYVNIQSLGVWGQNTCQISLLLTTAMLSFSIYLLVWHKLVMVRMHQEYNQIFCLWPNMVFLYFTFTSESRHSLISVFHSNMYNLIFIYPVWSKRPMFLRVGLN